PAGLGGTPEVERLRQRDQFGSAGGRFGDEAQGLLDVGFLVAAGVGLDQRDCQLGHGQASSRNERGPMWERPREGDSWEDGWSMADTTLVRSSARSSVDDLLSVGRFRTEVAGKITD